MPSLPGSVLVNRLRRLSRVPPVLMSVSPATVSPIVTEGGTPVQYDIVVTGTADIGTVTVGTVTGTGASAISSLVTGQTVTLVVSDGGLDPGNYTADVPIISGASNAPQSVTVLLEVMSAGTFAAPGERRGGPVNALPTSAEGSITFSKVTKSFDGTVMDTTYPVSLPATVAHLTDSGNPATNLTNLLAAVARNKVVTLPANATYDISSGSGCVFPSLGAGTTWCHVMSRAFYDATNTCAEGTRIDPTTHAADLATIRMVSTGQLSATFSLAQNTATASYYRFTGIKFTASDSSDNTDSGDLFRLSFNNGVFGHHIVFDRCVLDANTGGTRRTRNVLASAINFLGIVDSQLIGVKERATSTESHALVVLQGGPVKCVNTRFSDGQIGVLWGGGDPASPADAPHDLEFRRNLVDADPAYPNVLWTKCRMEIKFCNRWLVTGCVFKGSYGNAQVGALFHTTLSVTPTSNANAAVQNLDGVFWFNELKDGNQAIQVTGGTTGSGTLTKRQTRTSIAYNVAHQLRSANSDNYTAAAQIKIVGQVTDLEVYKNTFHNNAQSNGAAVYEIATAGTGATAACHNLYCVDNIFQRPTFGWKWSTEGIITVDAMTTGSKVWTNNVFYGGGTASNYDGALNGVTYTNFIASSAAAVGFASVTQPTDVTDFAIASGDYAAGGAKCASDGTQQGCDVTLLAAAVAGVE